MYRQKVGYSAVIFALFLTLTGCYTANNLIPSRLKTTYATLTVRNANANNLNSRSYSIYEFIADGQTYNAYSVIDESSVLGDKFLLKYDSIDPQKNHDLLLNKPIFLNTEEIGFATGKIAYAKSNYSIITFIYRVNNIGYSRIQRLDKPVKFYLGLKEGLKFEVKYWKSNPQRAIINVNKPINEMDTAIAIVEKPCVFDNNGSSSQYIFQVGMDTFFKNDICFQGITKGDKFKLLYDINSPANNPEILYSEPLFLKNEPTAFTVGTISVPNKYDNSITYLYTVNNLQYKRVQFLKFVAFYYPNRLRKPLTFKVEYQLSNPQRSIIYLGQPKFH